jgi:hypothetical protein
MENISFSVFSFEEIDWLVQFSFSLEEFFFLDL